MPQLPQARPRVPLRAGERARRLAALPAPREHNLEEEEIREELRPREDHVRFRRVLRRGRGPVKQREELLVAAGRRRLARARLKRQPRAVLRQLLREMFLLVPDATLLA